MAKTKAKMKTVRISRKHWCRGSTSDSLLRTRTGQSCCLGFVARACGVPTRGNPGLFDDLPEDKWDLLPQRLRPTSLGGNTGLHDELTQVNDGSGDYADLVGRARERKIATLLARAGIRAVFVD
jgi:hypothetical protein